MVWGGVSKHPRTELVIIAGNLNAVCITGKTSSPLKWYHNNATNHTTRSVRDFLQDRNISVLPWPVNSPDLNLIEHVWELAGALVEEWGNISQQERENLVQSMRRRCTAVRNAAGGHTRY